MCDATPTIEPSITPPDKNERERLHREMLSTVAHDLKTPLVSVIGSLEALTNMHASLSREKQAELTCIALEEAHRLNTLITNIVDMAKFDNKVVRPTYKTIGINEIVRQALSKFSGRSYENQIHFTSVEKIEVSTDPILASQVMKLVLDNAVKFGGTPLAIAITCSREDDMGVIMVQDNGPGIAEETRDKIFCKYERFPPKGYQNHGLGLGLAISRSIMDLLGGSINADNAPQSGALFKIKLPLSTEV